MLYTPAHGFLFSVDNFGATYTTAAFGTAVTQSASANTKGIDVELIPDTDVDADCYGMAIMLMASNNAAAVRNYLVDIKTDPAGGTSYATVIPNLLFNSGAAPAGGQAYYFPLYISQATSIAAASQANVGSGTANSIPRIGVRLFGKPTHPHLVKAGSFVRAFGPNTGTSGGTTITPGTSALGSYTASLGTTADDLWWWQSGMCINDTTQSDLAYLSDVACGDATNKVLCQHHAPFFGRATEQSGSGAFGLCPPMQPIASGANVYMRSACGGTPDSSITCAAYGLGG